MNKMIGLKEIFVLPSSKLFAGSPKLRECFLLGKGNNVNMNHKGTNKQNMYIHPLFCLGCFQVNKSRG
jgi:hypothetical protein